MSSILDPFDSKNPDKIQMTQENCIICNGTGKVAVSVSGGRRHKVIKCKHLWHLGSLKERVRSTKIVLDEARKSHYRYKKALATGKIIKKGDK